MNGFVYFSRPNTANEGPSRLEPSVGRRTRDSEFRIYRAGTKRARREKPEFGIPARWLEVPGPPTPPPLPPQTRARARDRQHTRHAHADPPFLGLLDFGAKTSRARARKCTTSPRRRARFNPTLLLVEFRRAHPQYFAPLLKALAPVPPTPGFGRRARVFITPGCSWLPRRRRRPLSARRARSIRTELNAPATQK